MPNRTALVTGATDGLGRAVAGELAADGWTVLLHGRDEARGQAALEEIRERTGNDALRLYLADLASLDEVRALADTVLGAEQRLDVLVNNAGIGGSGGRLEGRGRPGLRLPGHYLPRPPPAPPPPGLPREPAPA